MPGTCKTFQCNYLLEPGSVSRGERPDQCGAIFKLAVDRRQTPPMDRTTRVMECAPRGLMNVLRNRLWGPAIRRDLRAGKPILFAWLDDPDSREVLHVRGVEGRLRCELTSCHGDGSPVLKTLEPVHARPVHVALMIPNQDFAFEAEVLIGQLGNRSETVLGPSAPSETDGELHFLFTRRQAELLAALGESLRGRGLKGREVGSGTGVASVGG